jgi:hypothetical protein
VSEFINNFSIYTYTSQNIYTGGLAGCVSVRDKYLHWPHVSVIKFGRVSANDLHLHWIYMRYIWMAIDTYTHNTGEYRCVIKLAIGQTWVPHAHVRMAQPCSCQVDAMAGPTGQ